MRDDIARQTAIRALEIAKLAKAQRGEKGEKGDPALEFLGPIAAAGRVVLRSEMDMNVDDRVAHVHQKGGRSPLSRGAVSVRK